jgi:hypothetical protein
MEGFTSMMIYLSKRNRDEHKLKVFWPLIRDEMITHGTEYLFSSIAGTNTPEVITRLNDVCHDAIAYKAFQERKDYQSQLQLATISGYSTNGLHKTATQQFVLLKRCLSMAQSGTGDSNHITPILMDVRANLHPIDDEQILELWFLKITQVRGQKYTPSFLHEGAVGFLRLLHCRLLIVVLETLPLGQALYSKTGNAAAERLISFITRVYEIAFLNSGASDGAMMSRAIAQTEAAVDHIYVECKNLCHLNLMIAYSWLRLVGDCIFGEWFAFYWWRNVVVCLEVLDEICRERSNAYQARIIESLGKCGRSSGKHT